jgi:GNAT superfamily N-acetyltransferase
MFIVYGLPRSRTFWLSQFLSYREWTCGHDESRHVRSLADVDCWFSQPATGTVETAAAPYWRLIHWKRDLPTVVVRRPVEEVMASLRRLGMEPSEAYLRKLEAKLTQISARVPGALTVAYADLAREDVCAKVFEHCLPYKHDPEWWRFVAPLNLQAKMHGFTRYFEAHKKQLAVASDVAKQKMLARIVGRKTKPLDGLELAQEPLETFLRDGQALFASHLADVGEGSENWRNKNIELMAVLEQLGCLQITTARSNGKMFGYLMAVISPSLEDADRVEGVHTTFYASPDYPGLGLRLQRASLEALRSRGVNRAYFRAGTRGAGPRMGALYQRLGAEDFGQFYSLDLDAA